MLKLATRIIATFLLEAYNKSYALVHQRQTSPICAWMHPLMKRQVEQNATRTLLL